MPVNVLLHLGYILRCARSARVCASCPAWGELVAFALTLPPVVFAAVFAVVFAASLLRRLAKALLFALLRLRRVVALALSTVL